MSELTYFSGDITHADILIRNGDASCIIKNTDGKIHVEGELTETAKVFFDYVCQLWNTSTPQWQQIDIYEIYKTWPDDIRKKLSLHDLRRIQASLTPEDNV